MAAGPKAQAAVEMGGHLINTHPPFKMRPYGFSHHLRWRLRLAPRTASLSASLLRRSAFSTARYAWIARSFAACASSTFRVSPTLRLTSSEKPGGGAGGSEAEREAVRGVRPSQ
eukprot:7345867-Pyramimonas_sp.AAC.1